MTERSELLGRDIGECIALIEALGADVGWSFGTITNDFHAIHPMGRGVSVLISGPHTEKHPKPISVFEKDGDSFRAATERAIHRFKRRQLGEGWA